MFQDTALVNCYTLLVHSMLS